MAIKAIINNTEKEIEQIKSDKQDIDYVYLRVGEKEAEGTPTVSIESVGGELTNYRIYGNTINGESVGDLVISGEHTGEYRVPVTISRKAKHTATLQLHDCLPSAMQFDNQEALYYAENGLTAGTYNFTIQDGYSTPYGGGKTYQFTLANDVPAKGQLVLDWAYHTQASAAKITSYASSTSTTAIEQVGVTEGSGGTSLGTTDGNSTNVNYIGRARNGSNNYKESAIRQFLNSSAVAGSVWTPQTKYDRPPSWNASTAGFMKDIDSDFLAVLGASPKVVALNTITDGGGSVTINNDKFFLLSRSEVYSGKNNDINEGEPYPYYSNYSDLSEAGVDSDSNRIKYRSDTAQIWWLRSPSSARSDGVRNVQPSGYVGNVYANISGGVAPACNIALDEDYKFNGQVLHVRDQISVTKGNQTLVFDVIGIDHDEVHFDKRTVDIYLPEPLKMVGDEAEYIDYGEQKIHFLDGTFVDVTLPALSTIKGINTLSVNTSIQPSNIYIKDNFDYKKVFTATRTIEDGLPLNYRNIEDNESTLKNYRIYGNTVDGESVGEFVTEGEHAGEYRVPVTISRKAKHTATLQLHDCLPSAMQIDAPEALYYAENGLPAGTYNFTIQNNYDTSYGGGKTYQFTLANDVPAKGQLVFGWAYNTQASATKITSYASSTSTTAIEQVGVTEGSGGTSLGTTDGNSTNVNHINRARYGSNNYEESAIRQFLNSSAVAGSVWTPQTKYDRPPSWNSNTAGFMKDIDSDFLAVLGASPKVVALNKSTGGGGSVTINNDKFFLLSRSEVYGGKENSINEGEPYPYYSNYSDLSAAGTGDDSNRIKYRSGTAQVWWLRSPSSANDSAVRVVRTGGRVYGNSASWINSVTPACNIALDEDYKFNGQVLHVRDQISVTKGNQTLVFDVIGIDHDEVHFDKRTVDIYLPEPLKMVGDEAEYIDYGEQKIHFLDGTFVDVTLPALLTISGTNILSVNTEVQPSRVEIKGHIK